MGIMDVIKKIQQSISYWYVRYLLATELYMVETWERIVIHVLFGTIFGLFWYFNYSIVTNCVAQLRHALSYRIEQL